MFARRVVCVVLFGDVARGFTVASLLEAFFYFCDLSRRVYVDVLCRIIYRSFCQVDHLLSSTRIANRSLRRIGLLRQMRRLLVTLSIELLVAENLRSINASFDDSLSDIRRPSDVGFGLALEFVPVHLRVVSLGGKAGCHGRLDCLCCFEMVLEHLLRHLEAAKRLLALALLPLLGRTLSDADV